MEDPGLTQEAVQANLGQASGSEVSPAPQTSFDAPRWLVIATAGAAIFLSTLDSGIINIALPSLANEFRVDFKAIAWAVTLYMSTIGITISLFGRLADRFGLLRVLRFGFAVFALGSFACGCSISAVQLNGFRVLQGAGAAMMQATAAAVITTMIAPDRRKAALAIFATVLGLGPVLGPTVGGLIISWAGWRPVFWINLPICLFGLWSCAALKRHARVQRKVRLDIIGNLLLVALIFLILQILSTWRGLNMTFAVRLAACLLVGFLFFFWESRTAEPLLDPRLLLTPFFLGPAQAVLFVSMGIAAVFLLPPILLQGVRGLQPWAVGLVSFAGPLGIVLSSHSSNTVFRWIRNTRLMQLGIGTMFTAILIVSLSGIGIPTWALAGLLLLYGIGYGIYQTPNLEALMASMPPHAQGTIGAVQRMLLNLGNAFGATIVGHLLGTEAGGKGLSVAANLPLCWAITAGFIFVAGALLTVATREKP
jgi:MFS family permease